MTYNYTYSKHNTNLIEGLNRQRLDQSHFCDITIKTRDIENREISIFGHKCVLATTSEHLKEIINMDENQQHNLEYDMATMADAECIQALVQFSYTGELIFTSDNFSRMKQAIKDFKMKNIDDESLSKIEEDIERTKAKVAEKPVQPSSQVVTLPKGQIFSQTTQLNGLLPTQIIQIPIQSSNDPYGNRKIVPKINMDYPKAITGQIVLADAINQNGILVPVQTSANNQDHILIDGCAQDEPKLSTEDTNHILQELNLDMDEIANINRQTLASMVDKSNLTLTQKAMVWEVRRKNKNRLAAAKCRKRKLEDITINSLSREELKAEFMEHKTRNLSLRMELQEEEKLLKEKLNEYKQLSRNWLIISDALSEIKIALCQDEVEIEPEQVYNMEVHLRDGQPDY